MLLKFFKLISFAVGEEQHTAEAYLIKLIFTAPSVKKEESSLSLAGKNLKVGTLDIFETPKLLLSSL